jgi:hypothetical protein
MQITLNLFLRSISLKHLHVEYLTPFPDKGYRAAQLLR